MRLALMLALLALPAFAQETAPSNPAPATTEVEMAPTTTQPVETAPATTEAAPSPLAPDKVTYGFGGGFNLSVGETDNMEEDEDVDSEETASLDLSIGMKALIPFSETLGVRTGLMLQQKTSSYAIEANGLEGDVSAHVIYLSLPVGMQIELNKNFALFFGYQADYTINDYCSTSGDFDECSITVKPKQLVHVANLGLTVHASPRWDLDFNYQHGMSEVYEDLKIHTFQVLGFYKFQ